QAFGATDDEDPPATLGGLHGCAALEPSCRGDAVTRHAIGTGPASGLAPFGHDRLKRFGRFLDLLVGVPGLWPGDRHQPMDVRMGQVEHPPTTDASPARFVAR